MLAELNAGQGSAARVERLLLLVEPPVLDAGEITDKGYVNQRVVLEPRAELVCEVYADQCRPGVHHAGHARSQMTLPRLV